MSTTTAQLFEGYSINLSRENTTDYYTNHDRSHRRIVFLALDGLLLSVALYVFIALSFYNISRRFGKGFWRISKDFYFIGLPMSLFLFSHVLLGVLMVAINWIGGLKQFNGNCLFWARIRQMLQSAGVLSFCSFLWIRQYSLYKEPVFQTLATPGLLRFNWCLAVAIAVFGFMGFSGPAFTLTDSAFFEDPYDSACYQRSILTLNAVVMYPCFGSAIVVEVSLLFLFVRIFKKHERQAQVNKPNRVCSSSFFHIRMLVRCCCIATAVNVSTSAAVALFDALTSPKAFTLNEIYAMWDIQYVTTMLCSLACFRNRFEIVWPWKDQRNRNNM